MDLLEKYHKEKEVILYKELTDKVLRHFYRIYNDLGYGFLERVYKNALYYALVDDGLVCEAEKSIKVYHNKRIVGDYFCDLLVENCVMLELKTSVELRLADENQLMNYLKATDIEVGLLLNFGEKAQFKRKYFSNDRK